MKRPALLPAALLGLVLLSPGCATSSAGIQRQDDIARSEAEFRAAIKELAHAFSVGDAPKVVALASRDMHLIHPLRGEMTYDDYAGAVLKNMKPKTGQTTTATLDGLYASGDMVVTNITWYTITIAPDGTKSERGERDQEVWRREADGKWRLFRGASFPQTPTKPGS